MFKHSFLSIDIYYRYTLLKIERMLGLVLEVGGTEQPDSAPGARMNLNIIFSGTREN